VRIAEVAYPLPLHQSFDYEVPEALRGAARPGSRVRAAFGPRSMLGVVLSVRAGGPPAGISLKPLAAVLDAAPVLDDELLSLARWMAQRYCAPIGECVKILLPANLREAKRALPLGGSERWDSPARSAGAAFTLTGGQSSALSRLGAKLRAGKFSANLLFGVPASGKTEIYIRLIREAVSDGGQALFMVPEISLTKPFFDDFKGAVGLPVALWHSALGSGQRKKVWLGLRSGEVRVVVGARSASLLPLPNLRLAVIDEEQDESFKQDGQAPFYHAREVALERASRHGAMVVLGSATPSIEACSAAERGEMELILLQERVCRSTDRPPVRILERPPGEARCLSEELLEALKACMARREQAILLVNRRGYSNFIMCRQCAWVCRCPSCGVAYVHHEAGQKQRKGRKEEEQNLFETDDHASGSAGGVMICHHCGGTRELPETCGRCGNRSLRLAGVGTQKVVSELRSRLPGLRVLRMDSDTVSREDPAEEGAYEAFKSGKADVLVGTKLVAKGFHFPRVTLVGVVDADTMLSMPDFRCAERTVQLLVQAAGRAGRAERPGEVLLQTSQPTHYAIQAVARGDYAAFARQEMGLRRELGYPPASRLLRLLFSGRKDDAVRDAAEGAAQALREGLGPSEEILGPAPGVYAKLQGSFRHHLLIKAGDDERLAQVIEKVRGLRMPSGVKLKANVDPYDFF